MALFDWVEKQMSLPVVAALLLATATFGEIRYRFYSMESEVGALQAAMEDEKDKVALKEEVAVLEDRLRKWIGRMETLQEEVRELERIAASVGGNDGLE